MEQFRLTIQGPYDGINQNQAKRLQEMKTKEHCLS